MTEEELVNLIPPDLFFYLENGFNNQYISEIFRSYQEAVKRIKLISYYESNRPNAEDEIYNIIGFPPPREGFEPLTK